MSETVKCLPHKIGSVYRSGGFTLIEFMITIFIAAILATLAGPSFVQYIASHRVRTAANDLVSALQIARSEAIKRNTAVDVVRIVSGNWSGGWRVQFTGTVVRQQDAFTSLTITDSGNLSTITYGNDGRATTVSTVFKVQPATAVSGVTARCITISLSGVASSTVGGC